MIKNIDISEVDNLGGNILFYFAPAYVVNEFPDLVDGYIQSDIELSSGNWYQWRVTLESLQANVLLEKAKEGGYYKHSLKGFIAQDNADISLMLDDMRRKRFVLIRKDSNNIFKIMGTPDQPLDFGFDLATRGQYNELKGYSFEFTGETEYPEFFYIGNIATAEGEIRTLYEILSLNVLGVPSGEILGTP